jgi:hypothetical protein
MSRAAVAAFVGGSGVGVLVGVALALGEAERRARKSYEESFESLKRALERAHDSQTINVYAPAATEEDLRDLTEAEQDRVAEKKAVNIFDAAAKAGHPAVEVPPEGSGGHDLTRTDDDPEDPEGVPQYVNHYRKALAAKDTPVEMFVDGGINDYGCSYIEEDEYDEEDGRFKGQITIVMADMEPSFFMDGVQINDWAERVGESILVDFYRFVPPEAPPILYVRNHKRDEDYEVTREIA